MARHHMINGVRVDFTPEEEIARDAEEALWAAGAFDRAIAGLRSDRTRKLASTDWYALQDVTMSDASPDDTLSLHQTWLRLVGRTNL